MSRQAALAAIAAMLFLAPKPENAITKVGEIVLASNERAIAVGFEWLNAYVSLFGDGIQCVVDVSNQSSPQAGPTFNPKFGDQWGENIVYQGSFVSGHRFGGAG